LRIQIIMMSIRSSWPLSFNRREGGEENEKNSYRFGD